MFREMRRKGQLMSRERSEDVLRKGTSGVLALSGDDGYPYALPLSYVYDDEKIYFHCASVGHKIDAIANCDKASFCVIDQDEIVPEKFTTFYRSVIAFGRIHVMEDVQRKRAAIERLAERYSPGRGEDAQKEINQSLEKMCMLEFVIEHLSGKEAVELVKKQREGQ